MRGALLFAESGPGREHVRLIVDRLVRLIFRCFLTELIFPQNPVPIRFEHPDSKIKGPGEGGCFSGRSRKPVDDTLDSPRACGVGGKFVFPYQTPRR